MVTTSLPPALLPRRPLAAVLLAVAVANASSVSLPDGRDFYTAASDSPERVSSAR